MGDDAGLEPLKQRLIERTQGNPFFVAESVRTLVETQVLVGDQGAYRLGKALPTIQVPATVQAVLAARIDRLPLEEKQLLQTAAVIGTQVPLVLLQAIAEVPEEALHLGLAHLQAAEFLYETRLFPEHEYTFKHALTQQVAYETLLQERRRVLHARIVEALEGRVGDGGAEQVERLVQHALRGEVWDKALAYCRQAGEKAMTQSAHREAVGYFEQALSALPHLPETRDRREQAIDLRLALRSALLPSDNSGRMLALLHEAETLITALDDPGRLGQVSQFLAIQFLLIGAYDQAMAAGQRALTLALASRDAVLHALAQQSLGIVCQAQGDYRQAIVYLGQTVTFFTGVEHHERFGQFFLPAVSARAWLTACYAEVGRFTEGKAVGDAGLQIAQESNHLGSLMLASWGMGLLSLRQGDLPSALSLLERAVVLCREASISVWFTLMAAALGAAYTVSGRDAEAAVLLTQALEETGATDMLGFQERSSLPLGEAHAQAGRLDEAHTLAAHALGLARQHQERGQEAYALRLLGDVAVRRQPPENEPAVAHYHQALVLAEALGMRPLAAHCHRGLGTLYGALGRREQACAALATAVELYRAMDMTFWLSQTAAALAQVEG
jgi:tetratricopeptide (TPR) repeat protein